MKDIDKVELVLWIGIIVVVLSMLLTGCTSTKQSMKVHLFSVEVLNEINTTL